MTDNDPLSSVNPNEFYFNPNNSNEICKYYDINEFILRSNNNGLIHNYMTMKYFLIPKVKLEWNTLNWKMELSKH